MYVDIEAAGCTNTCRHCSVDGHLPYGDFFTLDELRALKQTWGPLTIRYEPTAYSDFPEVYDASISPEQGGWLVSNGFGLAQREDYRTVFEQLSKMGFHTIAFTLHGLKAHHDWFVCRAGAFDDIVLATQRAKAFGLQPNWQIYIDQLGAKDVPELVEMAEKACGIPPQIAIPYHRVGGRLPHYEKIRPTLEDITKYQLHTLVDDPDRNYIAEPEKLTAAAWLEKWRENPDSAELKHPYEPPTWPPDPAHPHLNLRIQRDRKVFLDPMCAAPIFLDHLSTGKDKIMARIAALKPPKNVDLAPQDVHLSPDEQERLHPVGFSLRYAAISTYNYLT